MSSNPLKWRSSTHSMFGLSSNKEKSKDKEKSKPDLTVPSTTTSHNNMAIKPTSPLKEGDKDPTAVKPRGSKDKEKEKEKDLLKKKEEKKDEKKEFKEKESLPMRLGSWKAKRKSQFELLLKGTGSNTSNNSKPASPPPVTNALGIKDSKRPTSPLLPSPRTSSISSSSDDKLKKKLKSPSGTLDTDSVPDSNKLPLKDSNEAQVLSDSEYNLECSLYASDAENKAKRSKSALRGKFNRLSLKRTSGDFDDHGFWVHDDSLLSDPSLEPVTWGTTVTKDVLKQLSAKDIKRQEMIYELIQTEKSFFRHLQVLRTLFRDTLEREEVLGTEGLRAMFSTLDAVFAQASPVCCALIGYQKRHDKQVMHDIGELLVGVFQRLDAVPFAEFCANQKAAISFYHSKLEKDTVFCAVIKTIEARIECSRLRFPDFVAKVMQRLTKYPLLIDGIMKCMPRVSAVAHEANQLSIALDCAKKLLQAVNQLVRDKEDQERLKFIQSKLDFSACSGELQKYRRLDITLGRRRLIKEGPLDLVVDDHTREVYLILLSDVMLITVNKDGSYILKVPGRPVRNPVLLLKDIHVRQEMSHTFDRKGIFLLSKTNACMYELRALTKTVQAQWLEAISSSVSHALSEKNSTHLANMMQPDQQEASHSPNGASSLRPSSRNTPGKHVARYDGFTTSIDKSKYPSQPLGLSLEEILIEDSQRYFVEEVLKDSMADKEGFMGGDLLVSINGESIEKYTIDEIRHIVDACPFLIMEVSRPVYEAGIQEAKSPSTHAAQEAVTTDFNLARNSSTKRRSSKKRSVDVTGFRPLSLEENLAAPLPNITVETLTKSDSDSHELKSEDMPEDGGSVPSLDARQVSTPDPEAPATPRSGTPYSEVSAFSRDNLEIDHLLLDTSNSASFRSSIKLSQGDEVFGFDESRSQTPSFVEGLRRSSLRLTKPTSAHPVFNTQKATSFRTFLENGEEDAFSSKHLSHTIVVLDFGSSLIRVGLAGQERPMKVLQNTWDAVLSELVSEGNSPAQQGKLLDELKGCLALLPSDPVKMFRTIFSSSLPLNEAMLKSSKIMIQSLFANVLGVSPVSSCLMLVDQYEEPLPKTVAHREFLANTIFDWELGFAGLQFADQGYLSCLGSGRRCALVVHSGATATYVLPVVRSALSGSSIPIPIIEACIRIPFAGHEVTLELVRLLRDACPDKLKTFDERTMFLFAQDAKEKHGYVAYDYETDLTSCLQSSALRVTYLDEFTTVSVPLGQERFACIEPLFRSKAIPSRPMSFVVPEATPESPGSSKLTALDRLDVSLQEAVRRSIIMCDPHDHQELWGNIVLSGGTTLFPGFAERLAKELRESNPLEENHIMVVCDDEARNLPWVGASLFTSLDLSMQRFVTPHDLHGDCTVLNAHIVSDLTGDATSPSAPISRKGSATSVDTSEIVSVVSPVSPNLLERFALTKEQKVLMLREKLKNKEDQIKRLSDAKQGLEKELDLLMGNPGAMLSSNIQKYSLINPPVASASNKQLPSSPLKPLARGDQSTSSIGSFEITRSPYDAASEPRPRLASTSSVTDSTTSEQDPYADERMMVGSDVDETVVDGSHEGHIPDDLASVSTTVTSLNTSLDQSDLDDHDLPSVCSQPSLLPIQEADISPPRPLILELEQGRNLASESTCESDTTPIPLQLDAHSANNDCTLHVDSNLIKINSPVSKLQFDVHPIDNQPSPASSSSKNDTLTSSSLKTFNEPLIPKNEKEDDDDSIFRCASVVSNHENLITSSRLRVQSSVASFASLPALEADTFDNLSTHINEWDERMVSKWLTGMGFNSSIVTKFKQNGMTGADLLSLTEADLLSMKITSPRATAELLGAAKDLLELSRLATLSIL